MYTQKINNFIENFIEEEKHRLPNFIPVLIGIGIYWYFCLDNEPNFVMTSVWFFSSIMFLFFIKKCRLFVIILSIVLLGFFISQLRTKTLNTFMLNNIGNKPISLYGVIESCEKSEKGLKITVKSIKPTKKYNCEPYNKLGKLNLSWIGKNAKQCKIDYSPGDKVLFRTILSPLAPPSFPGAYDFKKQQYFQGISARGFIVKQPKIIKEHLDSSFTLFIEKLRHNINKEIEKYVSGQTAAVAEALITGNKAGISKETRDYFAKTGTAHILAISGLHMGIIGFFVFWLFRIILCFSPLRFLNTKKISAILSWVVVIAYLLISGCSVPSIRAFIMHTLIIVAILLNRTPLTMRSVAIAATLIMLMTPEAILFPSFQMSFGAVIAIVAFYEKSWNFSPLMKTLANIVATTVVASIPTSVFSIFAFNQLTLNSILANIIVVPLMSFLIMPIAVSVLFFMYFGLHPFLTIIFGYCVDILITIAKYFSQLPGSFFVMHTPSKLVMWIMILSGLILTLIHHKIKIIGFFGCVIGVILYFIQPLPDIYISPNAKVVGIRTQDAACFSHLGYFRSASSAWAKSVGFEKRKKFSSTPCKKYIKSIGDKSYFASLNDKQLIISDNLHEKYEDEILINIDNESHHSSSLIFLSQNVRLSNDSINRPWS